jgi:hypothetical protein
MARARRNKGNRRLVERDVMGIWARILSPAALRDQTLKADDPALPSNASAGQLIPAPRGGITGA